MHPISRLAFAGTMTWLGLAALGPVGPAAAAGADPGATVAAQGDQGRSLPSGDAVPIPANAAGIDLGATAAASSRQNRPPPPVMRCRARSMPRLAAPVRPPPRQADKIARRPPARRRADPGERQADPARSRKRHADPPRSAGEYGFCRQSRHRRRAGQIARTRLHHREIARRDSDLCGRFRRQRAAERAGRGSISICRRCANPCARWCRGRRFRSSRSTRTWCCRAPSPMPARPRRRRCSPPPSPARSRVAGRQPALGRDPEPGRPPCPHRRSRPHHLEADRRRLEQGLRQRYAPPDGLVQHRQTIRHLWLIRSQSGRFPRCSVSRSAPPSRRWRPRDF